MRKAAADLEFAEAARLRDEVKRLKLLDLEFANDALTGAGTGGGPRGAEAAKGGDEGGERGGVQEGEETVGSARM